jgi:DNA polymerase type B, organellar and viral
MDLHAIAAKQKPRRKSREKTLKVSEKPIATIDFETDPFLYGRIPAPFAAGFYSEEKGYVHFWGNDCIARLCEFINALKTPHIIYAHNGGKFDFHFMLDFLQNPLKIINSRIASVKMGIHTLRDSYCILPIPLRVYCKDEIDYQKLEASVRETHKTEILAYLKTDCVKLHELVMKFIFRFGVKLTIGGTAIGKLQELHPFQVTTESHDERYRPFYFGGRVEALKTGIIKGNWKVYDVNSMYPHVMRNCVHPTGLRYRIAYGRKIDTKGRIAGYANAQFYFARIFAEQRGAFPTREKDKPLNFDVPKGEFFVTSHELKAALETGRAWNIKVIEAYIPEKTITFGEYVDTYMREKIDSKKAGDKAGEIFAKLLLNSAYGKFGSNPRAYKDYFLGDCPNDEYELYSAGIDRPSIWRKLSERLSFYDVATAASITGAARAVLMRALSVAKNPVYCDTDSIICEGLDLDLDESKLGAWKLEAEGDTIAVAGKKMYALRDGSEYVKTASKGVVLTGPELFGLCSGDSIEWHNQAPSFSLGKKETNFVKRRIKAL